MIKMHYYLFINYGATLVSGPESWKEFSEEFMSSIYLSCIVYYDHYFTFNTKERHFFRYPVSLNFRFLQEMRCTMLLTQTMHHCHNPSHPLCAFKRFL